MKSTIAKNPAQGRVFLLDRAPQRASRFSVLRPSVVTSQKAVLDSVALADKNSRWIVYEKTLTESLVKAVTGPPRSLGAAVILHPLNPSLLPMLSASFGYRLAFSPRNGFLPPEELADVLNAENAVDLFLGGTASNHSVDNLLAGGSRTADRSLFGF